MEAIVAVGAMAAGIYALQAPWAMRGYLAMGLLFTVSATITMTKTLRDEHEAKKLVHRIDEARAEKMLRALDGAYVLGDRGDGSTEVTYRLALDVSIPLIGMIKRKGEKILIDTALKGLKQRVESLA